jgi:SAM-dependent methyltransferase
VNDGTAGEVFVDPHGEKHPALTKYWQHIFAGLEEKARVIDLASGAGSIYAQLPENHGFDLHAVDISREVLEMLQRRVSGTTTVVCSADNVPYDDGVFDLVVSQFGIEYAGLEAFSEAARLVATGGRLAVLCHYKDGYIDRRNNAELAGANLAKDCAFIDKSIALTEAAFSGDTDIQMNTTAAAFAPAEKMLAAAVDRQQSGIHAHLYLGFRRLYEERHCYIASDITTWLAQMRDQLDQTIDRLTRMCGAALSRDDMDRASKMLSGRGLQRVSYSPFETTGNELPVAWKLTAARENRVLAA